MLQCVGVGNSLGSMLPLGLLLKFLPFTMLENASLLQVFPLKIRVKIEFLINNNCKSEFSIVIVPFNNS